MKHKTFSFLLAVLMSMVANVASAYDAKINGIYYNFNKSTKTAAVTYYSSFLYINKSAYSGSVVIPETFTYNDVTYSVTSIGGSAFKGCTELTSVEIPSSVTSIDYWAFYDCTGLTSVTIGKSVTSIGTEAFYGCSGLTSITIPESVTSIEVHAFDKTAWYDNQPDGLVYAGKVAYTYKGTMPENTEIVLEEGTLSIAPWAFIFCTGLTSVTIPESVTSIGREAFQNCTGLTAIEIPNSVTSIGDMTFYDCTGLTSVTIPNSVTSIGSEAFRNCSGLTSVTIPNSVTSIGKEAFRNCTGLTSVTIPNSVTSIGDMTFYGCKGLTSVTIGNRVTSIGSNAFGGCTGLIELSLGCGLQSIGSKAFADSGIRQLLVKSTTPPTATTNSFSEQTFLRTTLYVPVGTVDDYAYANGWYKFNTIKESAVAEEKVTNEYAYTLMNARTFDYAVYDAVNDRVKMVTISNVDETNPKHCWQTVTMYGRKYLYNIGAKKFAVPGTGEAGLGMSSDVCSISMRTGADGIVLGDNTEQQWALVVDTKMDAYMGLEDVIVTGVLPIDNGQLTMDNANGVYDLSGRKINVNDNDNHNHNHNENLNLKQLKKGVYIVNGRKVFIQR